MRGNLTDWRESRRRTRDSLVSQTSDWRRFGSRVVKTGRLSVSAHCPPRDFTQERSVSDGSRDRPSEEYLSYFPLTSRRPGWQAGCGHLRLVGFRPVFRSERSGIEKRRRTLATPSECTDQDAVTCLEFAIPEYLRCRLAASTRQNPFTRSSRHARREARQHRYPLKQRKAQLCNGTHLPGFARD
jgi:hypothetical protein